MAFFLYTLQRALGLLLVVLGVMTITFFLSRVLPGSPVELMLGARPSAEQIESARAELGLDQPLLVQYGTFLADAVQGDLGESLQTGRPVVVDLQQRLAATFELVTFGFVLALLFGIPLGVLAAMEKDRWSDHFVRAISIAGVALPVFFLGMLLQMALASGFQLFPLQGRMHPEVILDHGFSSITGLYLLDSLLQFNFSAFLSAFAHIVLPATTLMLATVGVVTRTTRNLMADALSSDNILTGRAYGVSERKLYLLYALKATLVPLLTILGLTYGFMLGGSILVEYVFDWPGIGSYVVSGLLTNDFPAVMGATLVLAFVYLGVNFVIDLLHHTVDPRLQPGGVS